MSYLCQIRIRLTQWVLYLMLLQGAMSAVLPRQRRPVRSMQELGCTIGWSTGISGVNCYDGGGNLELSIEIQNDAEEKTIHRQWAKQRDPKRRTVTAREVMLSFWKEKSGLPLEDLRHVVYEDITNQESKDAVQYVQSKFRPWCDGQRCKAAYTETEAFQYLIDKSPHAKGSKRFVDEFTEFSNLFISSFEWAEVGRTPRLWLKVNLRGRDED
ncbi:hypothetical protein CTRI78_v010797 [Colletotrichum trifolii]|uniref:Uncharacterized protein n=1 Tax=Colletotrichum trifolii TaxID=5466 RepID=A0A4R8QI83_COLTR|nr:hypothetical protein CTRI78_v010797 [Colletotrichum trifolii]